MLNDKFDKPYNPKEVEEKIYRLWEKSGYFNPDNLPVKKIRNLKLEIRNFCIVIPPPNVTGSLHMGHALNATIQDILIRKKRMEGYKTLWLPGTDHAGIATQNVVEKELKKQGLTRHDLGKEKFIEKVWEWKEKYGNIILDQLKKLGSSCDWSRTRFTMDKDYTKAVETAFLHYYKKGWIYQGDRVVNWCKRCQTSLSDLELEYEEEKGKLWHIRYPLKTKNLKLKTKSYIIVATTRPETMLGDTAVAVNPKDKRYKDLIGEIVILPIMNREIPIIVDLAVEMEFGTGAVKVTPAHDIADFEISERHKLPIIQVINNFGKMTKEAGNKYEGLSTKDAREKIVIELEKQGLIEKIEDYNLRVSRCYRCNSVIEPQISKQWFLKMSELAKKAKQAIKSGDIKFHPKRWEKVYFDWLNNIKDWCISRQIWWGHKIPVGHCLNCQEILLQPKIKANWFFVRHGETEWNIEKRIQGQISTAPPINKTGEAQAYKTAQYLKPHNIDLIISSDLKRAKETSNIIAKELNVEVIYDVNLRERHWGLLDGLTKNEIEEKKLTEIHQKSREDDFRPDGGESLIEVQERLYSTIRKHQKDHFHKNIIFVSHGGALRLLWRKLKNIPISEWIKDFPHGEAIGISIPQEPCKKCSSNFIEIDNDVLDTWFSSALWPFATLGWPDAKSKDLKNFYPTQVLSTARDIINLWVTRMIFSGIELLDKKPFSDVIIHPTILTKDGKRMSKSLGTGIDPMVLIEKYGADATRFGLIYQMMGGQDIHFSEDAIMAGKKFANKLWNISRFVLGQIGISNSQFLISKPKPKTEEDKKIFKKLDSVIKSVNKDIEKYNFGQALHTVYDFVWHDFADKYIEISKSQVVNRESSENTQKILFYALFKSLKLLHPFMPFITEEIYQYLPIKDKKLLIIGKWNS